MDRYEYKVRADEIRALIAAKQYREAVEIADTIDWRNVKNGMMLCTISDLYKICKRYAESRDILLLAYQRNPGGRMILYSLCELSIKLEDVVNAIEYYKEFVQVAPRDTGKYVLQYKLYEAQEVSLEERIAVLEELQSRECKEKWMYELAYLYHRVGLGTQCVEECNQIVIYFGEGKYVVKALELKRLHQPLSAEQDALYRHLTGVDDIEVKAMDVSQYSTIDLQKELANSLKEVLYDDSAKSESTNHIEENTNEQYESVVLSPEVTATTLNGTEESLEKTQVMHTEQIPEEVVMPKNDNGHRLSEAIFAPENSVHSDHEILSNMDLGLPREDVNDGRTQIYSKESLERALKSVREPEQAVKPTNASSTNFDDMLSLEGDGQIRLVVPEQRMVEQQITGQISLEDVLGEWERMKRESEKKWREDVRKRVLEYTGGIFADFDASSKSGLLERLEVSVNADDKDSDIEISEESSDDIQRVDVPLGTMTNNQEIADFDDVDLPKKEEVNSDITEITIEDDDEPEQESEPDPKPEPEVKSEPVQESEPEQESESEQESEPTAEELSFDRTPFSSGEEPATGAEPDIFTDNTTVLPMKDNLEYFMKFAAASEEQDEQNRILTEASDVADDNVKELSELSKDESDENIELEDSALEEVAKTDDEVLVDDPIDDVPVEEEPVVPTKVEKKGWFASHFGKKAAPIVTESMEVASEESVEGVSADGACEDAVEETSDNATVGIVEQDVVNEEPKEEISKEIVEEPDEVVQETIDEEGPAEDIPEEIDEEEHFVEEMVEEDSKAIVEEESQEVEIEEGPRNEISEEVDVEPNEDVSKDEYDEKSDDEYAEAKESSTPESKTESVGEELTPEQEERFEIFIETATGREQIVDAIKSISMEASTGNVIIGSDDTDGAIELSKALIMELQERDSSFNGKVAKVKARTLNAKEADATLMQFNGGAIIIQDANELRRETLDGMRRVLQAKDVRLFVAMTASRRTKHKFIMDNSDMLSNFTVSIDVEALDNAELVKYGKEYAYSREFAVDDMGILALHTRIDEMQTSSHLVNVVEVREIIEEAIAHATKKNVGHFFDVIVAKRYDKNDMIILKEKDFIHNK